MRFIRPKNLNKNHLILDIRPQDEYIKEHLALPHIHEDFDTLPKIEDVIKKYDFNNTETINILCSSGAGKAEAMANLLQEKGIDNIAIILGGMDGVKYDNLPTTCH